MGSLGGGHRGARHGHARAPGDAYRLRADPRSGWSIIAPPCRLESPMYSSPRLVVNLCFALVVSACSAGRRPLRSSETLDAAILPSLPDATSPPAVDAASNAGDILDGPFLNYEVVYVVCGNGRLDPGEQCDDGNTVSGDGCSTACTLEPGWRCRVPGKKCVPLAGFDAGSDLDDDNAVCGDGVISPFEECDCGDGSVPVPDACAGPNADGTYGGCTTRCLYGPFCGDGQVNGDEACDLGMLNGQVSGKDGCTQGCTKPHYCGDGLVDTVLREECDLGPLNGLRLDRDLNPSSATDAEVYCTSDCSIPQTLVR